MFRDWLLEQALCSPQKIGLIYRGQTWNHRALDQETNLLVNGLVAEGVESGMKVAVLLPNCPEYVLLVHAIARLAAILLPLNLRLTPAELAWQVQQADCALLIGNTQTLTAAREMEVEGLALVNIEALHPRSAAAPEAAFKGDDWNLERVQAIVFTSGTTGRPKGACLTFANHFWSAMTSAYRLGVGPGDRWLAPLPLYHVGGLALIFRSVLYGTALVLTDQTTPQAILQVIEAAQVTQVSLVPTMLQRLLELPGAGEKLAGLRLLLLGGAPAALSLLERSRAAGLNLALTYGMTETASQIATAEPAAARHKPGSVGKPLLFSRVRILNEAGQEVPAGQTGSIAVSGPTLMAGYYQQSAISNQRSAASSQPSGMNSQAGQSQPAEKIAEFVTGDLGYFDGEGDLWVVQRRVDLIISGGENIYPAEIEAVLLAHPEITTACVVGLPEAEWGQQVAAAVIRTEASSLDKAAVIDFCRQRLAGYKIPRQICFVDHLPMTESGKILRSQVVKLFGSSETLNSPAKQPANEITTTV